MEDTASQKEVPAEEAAAAPQPQQNYATFPEIQGDAFTQYNPESGWLWIGVKLPKFSSFRDAWAFVKSREFDFAQAFTQIERKRMLEAQLSVKSAPDGIKKFLAKLNG